MLLGERWNLLGEGFLRKKRMGIALGDFQEDFPEKERERGRPEQLGRQWRSKWQPRLEMGKKASGILVLSSGKLLGSSRV